jgi:SAM-dependent methyltransferase
MELVPCPIAGDRDFAPWVEAPDRFDLSGPSWSIVRSNSSGLVMLNPRPRDGEAAEHYPHRSYDPFVHEGNARSARDRAYLLTSSLLLGLRASIVMNGLRKPAGSVHILESGCSTGRLLMRMHRNYGIPVQNLCGIEPDRESSDAARASGLPRIYGADPGQGVFGCRFDRIVFWHSLEHIHRIEQALASAHDLLEPDGMLVIALPNIGSLDSRRYGKGWVALDAPRHLYHFTPDSLGRLLSKHGFSVADVRAYAPDALYNAWYSEKLVSDISGRCFGLPGAVRATLQAAMSVFAGIDPSKASGIVCRALRSGQEPGISAGILPSDFSISAEATRKS